LTGIRSEIDRMIREDDLPGLLTRTGEVHGHHCVGSTMGVIAAHRAMKELGVVENTGMEHVVAIVETNNCFTDGVQVVTGCTFGNNALIYRDLGKMALTLVKRDSEGVRLVAKPDAGDALRNEDPEASRLYRLVVNERKATPEEEARMIELNRRHCYNVLNVPVEEIFEIERVHISPPASYSRLKGSLICAGCGEKVMETRVVEVDGKPYCLSCSGDPFSQLDWSGISMRSQEPRERNKPHRLSSL